MIKQKYNNFFPYLCQELNRESRRKPSYDLFSSLRGQTYWMWHTNLGYYRQIYDQLRKIQYE